jgi:deazaflavin-dependent oxidoreductase (nitroreductase family)
MTFDTPHGTHGARQPSANVASRMMNGRTVKKIRAKGGRGIMGMNTLVLTTIGAKTGSERTTPVAWFPGGDDTWIIAASAGGATGNPAWYHNLAAHPDRVKVELDGKSIDVIADQLHGDERDRAWAAIVAAVPRFKGYETATDRQIPVIRLRRRTAA